MPNWQADPKKQGIAERTLIVQALKEAASYTRDPIRKKWYLELAAKMKECEKESVR